MKKSVEIIVENEAWAKFEGYNGWIKSLDALLQEVVKKRYAEKGKCWLGLLLTDDQHIKILNRNFRGINNPTNVLSFPEYEPELFKDTDTFPTATDIFLGDIAMSCEQIMRECEEYGMSFFDRCSHLFVHGILHLFGADHIEPEEQEKMESMEIEILARFSISNPYILKGEKK